MVEFFSQDNANEIKRRKLMAEQLRAQSQIPQQTQIVSGYAVPQSPLAGLASMLSQGVAGYQEGQAAELEKKDTDMRQKFLMEAIKGSGGDSGLLAEALMSNPAYVDQGLKMYSDSVKRPDWQRVNDPQLGIGQVNATTGEWKPIKTDKQIAEDDKKSTGKQNFEDTLATIKKNYDDLYNEGGITSTENGGVSNFLTSMQTSDIGQGIGKMLGTENQSKRNNIAGSVPLLTNAIKEATGMSAQQMNSNVELQTFLKALGDPKNDYESNMEIIRELSKKFGTGEVGQSSGEAAKPAAATDDFDSYYESLPSGAVFTAPDGTQRRKP